MIIRGVVVRGESIGRKIGFPTANIRLRADELVDSGVYASRVVVDGVTYRGISNVGVKPTVGGSFAKGLECHIFDLDTDLYGKEIEVDLHTKLRDEMRFESVEELRKQISEDIEKLKQILNNIK